MGKPLNTNPVADLPVNWQDNQIIAPSGADVGLSQQHGYNYLGGKVNEALNDISAINDFCGKIQPVKKTITLSTAGWTLGGTVGGVNYYVQNITITGYTLTTRTKPDVTIDSTGLMALVSSKCLALYCQNNNGAIKAVAVKNKPTAAVTIDLYLSEVDA